MEQGIRPFRVITPQADRTWVLPQGTGNGHNHMCSEENPGRPTPRCQPGETFSRETGHSVLALLSHGLERE